MANYLQGIPTNSQKPRDREGNSSQRQNRQVGREYLVSRAYRVYPRVGSYGVLERFTSWGSTTDLSVTKASEKIQKIVIAITWKNVSTAKLENMMSVPTPSLAQATTSLLLTWTVSGISTLRAYREFSSPRNRLKTGRQSKYAKTGIQRGGRDTINHAQTRCALMTL